MEANLEPIISYEHRTYNGFREGKMVTSLTKKSVVPVISFPKILWNDEVYSRSIKAWLILLQITANVISFLSSNLIRG